MKEKHTCYARTASRPTWENRFCANPATKFAKGHWWCWRHAPKEYKQWGVYCSASAEAGCHVPVRKFSSEAEARAYIKYADSGCQTPGSTHTVRGIKP